MTKVTILNEEIKSKKLTRIKFEKKILETGEWEDCNDDPKIWNNVVLLHKQWRLSNMDLMFAFDNGTNNGYIVLGFFNDGIV